MEPAVGRANSASPRRPTREHLGRLAGPGILPIPTLAEAEHPAGPRARTASLAGLDPITTARRFRARDQAAALVQRADTNPRVLGLQAQVKYRDATINGLHARLHHVEERAHAAAITHAQRSQPLDVPILALADAIVPRLAAALAPTRLAVAVPPAPAPRPAEASETLGPAEQAPGTSATSPPAPLEASPPTVEVAVLQHPTVLQALRLRDQEILRLRRALIDTLGAQRASGYILNVFAAPSRHVSPGLALDFDPLPPWGRS